MAKWKIIHLRPIWDVSNVWNWSPNWVKATMYCFSTHANNVLSDKVNSKVWKYFDLIMNRCADWLSIMTLEERIDFEQCIESLWHLISEIEIEMKEYSEILSSDFMSLSYEKKFYFTFMLFLLNVGDRLNIKNMKNNLKELMIENPKIWAYKKLFVYFDLWTELTKEMIEDWVFEVELWYLLPIYDNFDWAWEKA